MAGFVVFPAQAHAQVHGTVLEADSSEPVIQAAVQLLSPSDSSQVVGGTTDNDGRFSLAAKAGNYVLRVSYIGFRTVNMNVNVPTSAGADVGMVLMNPDAMWLEQAVVTAAPALVTTAADTVVYNPSAMIVQDDAMLSDLLKKIPGMEIDEKGNVLLNGREVKQVMVNGKRYFEGDVAAGLRSMPAEMVEKIRTYERQSDYARITGVEEGEGEPVIDVKVKPAFLVGWQDRLNVAYGTSNRYNGRFNGNRIRDDSQVTVVAAAHNNSQPNMYAAKSNQTGNGSDGENNQGEVGVNFSKDKPKADLGGSVHYDWSLRNAIADTRSENIYSTSNTYGQSASDADIDKHNFKANGNFEFKPSKYWNILLKPSVSYSRTDNTTSSHSTTFNNEAQDSASMVNSFVSSSHLVQDRFNANVTAQVYHRFNDKGLSASLREYLEYAWSGDDSWNDNSTRYYKVRSNPDSVRLVNRYQTTGVNSINSTTWFTFTQPVAKGMYLQFVYRLQYRYYSTDKDSYDYDVYDPSQSGLVHYNFYSNTFTFNYRLLRKKFNVTAGVSLVPQYTRLVYPSKDATDTTTRAFSAAPNVTLRYNPSKLNQLSFTYSSYASPPNTNYLLAVPSSTNPLYVRIGNRDLLPTFTHNMNFSWNWSDKKKLTSVTWNAIGRIVQRSVSMSTEYDPSTGVRTVKPMNIDGNWNGETSVIVTRTFGNSGFSLSSNSRATYNHGVGYLYNSKTKTDDRNVSQRAMGIERFSTTYRNKWLELTLNLAGAYTSEHSQYRPSMDQQPWSLSAGVATMVRLPWKMTYSTDFTEWCQRGYVYQELDRDYLLWNMNLAQSFCKGRLTLSVAWHDVLRQQENMVRTFTSDRRSISTYNGVTSYVLFRLSWRFKVG